jgi:hypothetical protein
MMRQRVAPSVFSTTASRVRRKRVLAMRRSQNHQSGEDRESCQETHHKRNLMTTLSMRSSTSAMLMTVTVGKATKSDRSICETCFESTRAAVPDRGASLSNPEGSKEAGAAADVLLIGTEDRGHRERNLFAVDFNLDSRAHADMNALGCAFADRDLMRVGIGPPLALPNLVSSGKRASAQLKKRSPACAWESAPPSACPAELR